MLDIDVHVARRLVAAETLRYLNGRSALAPHDFGVDRLPELGQSRIGAPVCVVEMTQVCLGLRDSLRSGAVFALHLVHVQAQPVVLGGWGEVTHAGAPHALGLPL